ncbi:hypothetical protein [Yeguia hominis]|uniref:Uncharacterized protein n=1 Tax=Yeguia hominis TaxID=2763662 RepID=A0A926HR56_9FIRM|nr:hypothetical protein [Yeguia hominis]MBC8533419.1 hypothetical protein [Yeguia hominis]
MGRVCRNSVRSAADRFNKAMKNTVCKVVTVVFALLPVFGFFGCGGSKKYTSDDIVLISTAYYGTEMNPVYSFALKKEKDGWLFSADCLVGSQKDHYTSFGAFPITAEDAESFFRIICEDGETERLCGYRNRIRIFNSSDAPTRSSGMTFSDGNTIEKETMLGDRALNCLYALADRYYEAAESSADTPPDTATN